LLQTAVQVDDAHLSTAPILTPTQAHPPLPKVITDAARTVVIVTAVCLVILLGYIYSRWPFAPKDKDIIKDKDKTSIGPGNLPVESSRYIGLQWEGAQ